MLGFEVAGLVLGALSCSRALALGEGKESAEAPEPQNVVEGGEALKH